jgi:predicted ABC-type transport system involved in lysophospholipase L1 biosynthesis ATPase subunit
VKSRKKEEKWLTVGRALQSRSAAGHLDRRSGNEVFNIMREMNREKGVAFIMVTHDDRIAHAADRILANEDGWVHEVNKRQHRMKLLSNLRNS